MKSLGLALLLMLPLLAAAKKVDPPGITIESAIAMAKTYVQSEAIGEDGNFIIDSAEYLHMYNEYQASYWRVKWEKIPRTKGGWFAVKIYQNQSIAVEYGE